MQKYIFNTRISEYNSHFFSTTFCCRSWEKMKPEIGDDADLLVIQFFITNMKYLVFRCSRKLHELPKKKGNVSADPGKMLQRGKGSCTLQFLCWKYLSIQICLPICYYVENRFHTKVIRTRYFIRLGELHFYNFQILKNQQHQISILCGNLYFILRFRLFEMSLFHIDSCCLSFFA